MKNSLTAVLFLLGAPLFARLSCDCSDYLYLNDTGLNYVEKFRVNADGSVQANLRH